MPFAPVDISGGQVSGVSDLSGASPSIVNFEVDESGANTPRAALAQFSVSGLTTAPVNGLAVWGNYLIVATSTGYWHAILAGSPTGSLALNNATTSTQLAGGKRPVFVSGESNVYATAGYRIRRWAPSTPAYAPGIAEELTSSPLCTHIASIGQYLIANDIDNPSYFRWSDIGEGTWDTWPAANVTTASARPDPIVAIAETVNELFVWGSETMQVYQVGSDPTLPFDLVTTADIGMAAPYAFTRWGSSFAFLDHHRRIVMGDGRSEQDIGKAIQKDLRNLTTISDAFAYREEFGQLSRLVFRFPTVRRTFVYDMGSQKWCERSYYSSPFQVDYPAGAYVYWPALNRHVVGSNLSAGGLFRLDGTTYTENGSVPVVCERTTGWTDNGTRSRKRSHRLQITMKRGNATTATVASQGALEVRVQDDERAWGDWKSVHVGYGSDFRNVVDVRVGGIYRRRRYGFRWSSSEETAIAEVHQEFDEVAP